MDQDSSGSHCLTVLVLHWPTFTAILSYEPPYKVKGAMVKIMDILAKKLQFCYQMAIPEHENWGKLGENGSYDGLLGQLQRGEAAMSMVPLGFSYDRFQAVDFSDAIHVDDQRVMYKRPTPRSDVAGFIKPYTPMLWLSVFLSTLVVFVTLLLLEMMHTNLNRQLSVNGEEQVKVPQGHISSSSHFVSDSVSTIFWQSIFQDSIHKSGLWTFSSLLAQSVPWEPQGGPVRVLAGLWLLVSLTIATVYRSNLKAMIILPITYLPFNNIEQLTQTNIPVYVIPGSNMYHGVKSAEANATLGKLGRQVISHGDILSAIDDVYSGLIAGFASYTGVRMVVSEAFTKFGYCRLYMPPEGLLHASIGLAFPKNSALKPSVNKIIRSLKEMGILDHFYAQEITNGTHCLKPVSASASISSTNTMRPLEMADVYGMLSVYVIGVLLSILIFLLEFPVHAVQVTIQQSKKDGGKRDKEENEGKKQWTRTEE